MLERQPSLVRQTRLPPFAVARRSTWRLAELSMPLWARRMTAFASREFGSPQAIWCTPLVANKPCNYHESSQLCTERAFRPRVRRKIRAQRKKNGQKAASLFNSGRVASAGRPGGLASDARRTGTCGGPPPREHLPHPAQSSCPPQLSRKIRAPWKKKGQKRTFFFRGARIFHLKPGASPPVGATWKAGRPLCPARHTGCDENRIHGLTASVRQAVIYRLASSRHARSLYLRTACVSRPARPSLRRSVPVMDRPRGSAERRHAGNPWRCGPRCR
jgi:hypothetical protein